MRGEDTIRSLSFLLLAAATAELLVLVDGFVPTCSRLPCVQNSVAATKRFCPVSSSATLGVGGRGFNPSRGRGLKARLRMGSLADDINADFEELIEANREWVKFKKELDPDCLQKTAAAHDPYIFWIGSSDSRAPSNEAIGTEAGEVFTYNNIANVVMNTDNGLMSAFDLRC